MFLKRNLQLKIKPLLKEDCFSDLVLAPAFFQIGVSSEI